MYFPGWWHPEHFRGILHFTNHKAQIPSLPLWTPTCCCSHPSTAATMLFKKKNRQQRDHMLKHDCSERMGHEGGKRHDGPSDAPLIIAFHSSPSTSWWRCSSVCFSNCFDSWCLIWVCVFYLPWHRRASPRRLPWWCSCLFHTPQDTCNPQSLGSATAPGSSWSRYPRWPPWSDPWTCRTGWKKVNVYTGEGLTWLLRVSHWSGPAAGWVWVLDGWFWQQQLDEWG